MGKSIQKIAYVVGTRPNIIKLSGIYHIIKTRCPIEPIIIDTGQHSDASMSSSFYSEFRLPTPNYCMNINKGDLNCKLSKMILQISLILEKEKPSWIIIFGDVISSLAGAISATNNNINVIHVEGGLRSDDKNLLENKYRIMIDHLSSIIFVTEQSAIDNLDNENVNAKIYLVGNILSEITNLHIDNVLKNTYIMFEDGCILVTLHRRSLISNDLKLKLVVDILKKLSVNKKIIFPVHPHTYKKLEKLGLCDTLENGNILITEPLSYTEFLSAMLKSDYVITDSGGAQSEAVTIHKPVVVLRDDVEHKEVIKCGYGEIAKLDYDSIIKAREKIDANDKKDILYWDAGVSSRIATIIGKEVCGWIY